MTVKMTIDIEEDFKNQIKGFAYSNGLKLRDFIVNTLKEKMEREEMEEDRLLGEFAQKCDAEGYIGEEESNKLTDKLKQCLS